MIHDIAIVGAGIFGLALAREYAAKGRDVLLLEQHAINDGSMASSGLLGALMPASPLAKGPLSRLQLHALSQYPNDIAALQTETGIDTGYRRAGRVQPVADPALSAAQRAACALAWRDFPPADHLTILHDIADRFPDFAAQLAPSPAYLWDGVTAQVTPRKLLAALHASIKGKITIVEQAEVTRIATGLIETAAKTYRARRIIVTAGWRSAGLTGAAVKGVKGHALAVDPLLTRVPLLYGPDAYVVFHDGISALGSTTEKEWTDTSVDPAQISIVHTRAASLVPALANAPIRESWAGIRPRGPQALPVIQQMQDGIVVATGGYKIGLALGFICAQLLADAPDTGLETQEKFWNWADQTQKIGLFSYT